MLRTQQESAAAAGGPSEAEIRAELETILRSAGFRKSARMQRFLRFTVERTLAGARDELKEFSIGRDVFDRRDNYDPRTDSIVRVEAQRLRKKLRAYYDVEGLLDKVVIQYRPGNYVPAFSRGAPAETEPVAKPLDPQTVAVLPFANLSSDPEQNYFCEGISEDIIDALSTVCDLHVLGCGTTFLFRDRAADPRAIGAELGAGTMVEGSVRKGGGMLRVTARLIDTETGRVRWSITMDRPESDVFAIKDEIATAITRELCDQLKAGIRLPAPAPSIDAYALYLKGRRAEGPMEEENHREAIEYYTRAIERFPEYAPPYSGLADVYTTMALQSMGRPSVLNPIAKRAAEEALRLDPGLAHAYTSLAWIVFFYEWNWNEGLALARKAVSLEPNYAYGHDTIGSFYMILGRTAEAREKALQAVRLDPLAIRSQRLLGLLLSLEGKFEEAERRLEAALALAPASQVLAWILSGVYLAAGRVEDGLAVARRFQTEPVTPAIIVRLGQALAMSGQTEEARAVLERIEEMRSRQFMDPWLSCCIYAALGEYGQAFEMLERSVEEHSVVALYSTVDPLEKMLRADPRFQKIMARLHLPPPPRPRAAKG